MPIAFVRQGLGAKGSNLNSDLLKRHAASHDVDEGGGKRQRTSESGRSRVSQACAACAAAKLKCEQKKPCQRCQQKQISCDFPPASNRPSERRDSAIPLHNGKHALSDFGSREMGLTSYRARQWIFGRNGGHQHQLSGDFRPKCGPRHHAGPLANPAGVIRRATNGLR